MVKMIKFTIYYPQVSNIEDVHFSYPPDMSQVGIYSLIRYLENQQAYLESWRKKIEIPKKWWKIPNLISKLDLIICINLQ